MDIVVVCSTAVTALATVIIACYARQTKISQDRFQEQLSDLYKGIIIATLLSANSDETRGKAFVSTFEKIYDGKTRIFGQKKKEL